MYRGYPCTSYRPHGVYIFLINAMSVFAETTWLIFHFSGLHCLFLTSMSATPTHLPRSSPYDRSSLGRLPVEVSRIPIPKTSRSLRSSRAPTQSSSSTRSNCSRYQNTFHASASIFMMFSNNLHPLFALGTSSGDLIRPRPQITIKTRSPSRSYTRYAHRRL